MEKQIEFFLNGEKVQVQTDPLRRLLDLLRDEMGLTGPKEGCGEGECGACSVLIDGILVNSCLVAVGSLGGRSVLTIEGYRETERFKVIEQAFADAGAVQCGFCIPGMVLAAEALLNKNAKPTEDAIREAISGNLCRCTGYTMIVEAVQLAAQRGDGLW